MKLAFVFPGQGAQYVGMGQALLNQYPEVKETFGEADEALGYSLSRLILEGPESDLRLTYHTQPALLTVSVAAYRVFQSVSGGTGATVMAGHSLGEYSALVAADAIPFADAVRLVHHRGKLMDEAVPAGLGAMSAVLGLDESALATVCLEASTADEVVELANLNCPGQIVISGSAPAVERAGVLAKAAGARRVMPLVVSGPFHCRLMQPAAERLAAALASVPLRAASVPIVANVDARLRTEPGDIRTALEKQLYSPVRWEDDVRSMISVGVEGFVEFGPGTVLSGLVKKVDKGIPAFHVEDETSLQETIRGVSQ